MPENYTIEITKEMVGEHQFGYRVYCMGHLSTQGSFYGSVDKAEAAAQKWINQQSPGKSNDVVKTIEITESKPEELDEPVVEGEYDGD